MKKIINNPNEVVSELLEGLALANPSLEYTPTFELISRKEMDNKVGVLSGGGSGHEPAHAGYVGEGMLDVAVAGNVFSSPSPDRIIEGIRKANQGHGVLMVIKNYSGDIMNFELAEELAELEDITVDHVVVRDDVAVEESTYSTGRRGIAGTVFIHKVAGAMAQKGADLPEVKRVAEKAIDRVRSMGMAMSPCTLPAVGKPGFSLEDDEFELGMGIHGEPGIRRAKMVTSNELAHILVDKLIADYDYKGKKVALMINGLGATPLMELYILNKDVRNYLNELNIDVKLSFVGDYMTALDMSGCSVSLLDLDEELEGLLFEPCATTALTMKGRE